MENYQDRRRNLHQRKILTRIDVAKWLREKYGLGLDLGNRLIKQVIEEAGGLD
jgi:hypothetical protein